MTSKPISGWHYLPWPHFSWFSSGRLLFRSGQSSYRYTTIVPMSAPQVNLIMWLWLLNALLASRYSERKFMTPSMTYRIHHDLGSIFFLLLLATLQHMEFPGKGSDLSCRCSLCCSCGNAGFLTHCAGLGMETTSHCSRDTADPVSPQRELPLF